MEKPKFILLKTYVSVAGWSNNNLEVWFYSPKEEVLATISTPPTGARLIAKLVNKFAEKIEASSFGYKAKVPFNVAVAIWYAGRFWRACEKELLDIVATGEVPILKKISQLCDRAPTTAEEIFQREKIIPEKILSINCYVAFTEKPTLARLVIKDYFLGHTEHVHLNFDLEQVNFNWVKKVLTDGLTKEELNILEGVALLSRSAQQKFVSLLSRGKLSKDKVASALQRAALRLQRKSKKFQKILRWLKKNNFEKEYSDIIIRRTLL